MQFGFYFDQSRCIGCYTCVVACKDWHDISAGPISWARISFFERGQYPLMFFSYLFNACLHCTKPLCVKACPVNAITKRTQDGIVKVESEICVGGDKCDFACRKACPYEAPQFGIQPNSKMQKCDLCLERWHENKKPICVEACPMRALDAGPLETLKVKYGDNNCAEGFVYSNKLRPSIVFKSKGKS